MQVAAYRNTEQGIAAKKASNVVPIMDAALLRRRAELQAELAELVRQKAEQLAIFESHKEHVERLLKCREDMEAAMVKASDALLQFRNVGARMMRTTSINTIIRRVCKVFNISRVDLISAGRSAHAAAARHAVCYWATRRTPLSSTQIGRVLGNRDHTTILHGKTAYVKKRAAMGRKLREV